MNRDSRSADEAAIARQIERFIASYNAGDAETLLSTYSEDPIKLRQGAPDESEEETARRLREFFAAFDVVSF